MKDLYTNYSKLLSKIVYCAAVLLLCTNASAQSTYLVNSTADNPDADLTDNVCGDMEGNCTLRAAIENANNTVATDKVHFNIPGEGPQVILLKENLPPITETVELDATTQPEYALMGTPVVVIDGNLIPHVTADTPVEERPRAFYFSGNSSGSLVRGFVLGGFGYVEEDEAGEEVLGTYSPGIAIVCQTGGHLIQANYIGVAADGKTPFKNTFGIVLNAPNTTIGGTDPKSRNVVSGSWRAGVHAGFGSSNIQVIGNYIGTSADGSQAIRNRAGVNVSYPSYGNHVAENVISGNTQGINLAGGSNVVVSNYIGVDPSGTFAIPNSYGVLITSKENVIGAADQGNLISGNQTGICFYKEATHNRVFANFIGTSRSGSSALPNEVGISFSSAECRDNVIGALEPGEANIIAYNSGYGVLTNSAVSCRNRISGNQIYANALLGIDLGADGATANDRNDADSGPNLLQNAPVISGDVTYNGSDLSFSYFVPSSPSYATYPVQVELFRADGTGQGKVFLRSELFTEADFNFRGGKPKAVSLSGIVLSAGDKIVATATDAKGNTSEFGAAVPVTFTGAEECTTPITYYMDGDGDGFGDASSSVEGCSQPEGYVTNSDDCDDTSSIVGPSTIWYADTDGDAFGDAASSKLSCSAPAGYVADATDCNDQDAAIYPGALEIADDGIDQNCDGVDGSENCTGTDVLTVSEGCADDPAVERGWVINNPGSCTVQVRWELRKSSETGSVEAAPGDTYFTTPVASKGPTQVTIYWNDTNGLETSTSANSTGIACPTSTSVQLSTVQNPTNLPAVAVSVYPNPIAAEGLWLEFPAREARSKVHAYLYDLSGRMMAEKEFELSSEGSKHLWEVDQARWATGMYILILRGEGTYQQVKVMK